MNIHNIFLSSTIFFSHIMKKHKGRTLVPKKGRDHVSMIRAYWFNEIEP